MAITAEPTGDDLCSGTTPGDTLPDWNAGYEEREITFDAGAELISGVTYAIVVRAPDAVPMDSDVLIAMKSPGIHANGNESASTDSGNSWAGDEDYDWWFKTKAGAVEKDTYEPIGMANWDECVGTNWFAQTFTASSDYIITSVVLKLERYMWDTTGTVTVSIKATAGAPIKATNPTPTDTASNVTLDQATITWEDGGGATSYNVYYGVDAGSLVLVSEGQVGLSFTITGIVSGSPFNYIIDRSWRIDAINAEGITTGDVWTFTTIRFDPPSPTYQYSDYYYRLLVDGDGNFGAHPADGGVEDIDYVIVASAPNIIKTPSKLIVAANNKIWYEDV